MLEIQDSGSFATTKFIDSCFVLECFADGSKDVDLVSKQVVVRDTRFDGSVVKGNVFPEILAPVSQVRTPVPPVVFLAAFNGFLFVYQLWQAKREGSLQAEVHYRSTSEFTRLTIVLNNMRLLAVFDWWERIRDFILSTPSKIHLSDR